MSALKEKITGKSAKQIEADMTKQAKNINNIFNS